MISWGLDTSHWEGTGIKIIDRIIGKTGKVNVQYLNTFNLQQSYMTGAKFILVKATEGVDIVDPVWEDTANDAKSAKLVNFPYHFFRELDPAEQANWFISNLAGRFDGVPVIDYEIIPKNPTAVLASLVGIGRTLISAYHLVPLIYTSPYYLSFLSGLDLTPLLIYNLWLAWWNPGFITNCYPWAGYLARQWTDRGKLPGIPSSVDLDYMLDSPSTITLASQI